jgi:hypothetical protein
MGTGFLGAPRTTAGFTCLLRARIQSGAEHRTPKVATPAPFWSAAVSAALDGVATRQPGQPPHRFQAATRFQHMGTGFLGAPRSTAGFTCLLRARIQSGAEHRTPKVATPAPFWSAAVSAALDRAATRQPGQPPHRLQAATRFQHMGTGFLGAPRTTAGFTCLLRARIQSGAEHRTPKVATPAPFWSAAVSAALDGVATRQPGQPPHRFQAATRFQHMGTGFLGAPRAIGRVTRRPDDLPHPLRILPSFAVFLPAAPTPPVTAPATSSSAPRRWEAPAGAGPAGSAPPAPDCAPPSTPC